MLKMKTDMYLKFFTLTILFQAAWSYIRRSGLEPGKYLLSFLNILVEHVSVKLLQQGYWYKRTSKNSFYYFFNVGLKTHLRKGPSGPEFYGDFVYKFKKLIGRNDFSFQFCHQ